MRTKSKSSITTDLLPNPHPGEILLEEFLKPQKRFAHLFSPQPRKDVLAQIQAMADPTDVALSMTSHTMAAAPLPAVRGERMCGGTQWPETTRSRARIGSCR